MYIFTTVESLQQHLNHCRRSGRSIGFAPTMGALHQGHVSLVERSRAAGHYTVASIFVNPTQFNDPKDLEKYPRTPEKDTAMLESAGCEVLFMPPIEEVYPPGLDVSLDLDFGPLAAVMEGRFRPGHFAGMATVVKRLLDIVQPDALFMGQKDYQQLSIVRRMLELCRMPVELVMVATLREADGLAMSSRNVRLTPEMRAIAPVIHRTLQWAKSVWPQKAPAAIEQEAMQRLEAAGLRPEYFEIVDGHTLQPIGAGSEPHSVVACTAAFAGEIRLIDNLVIR
jgi:pantoate--beta-alanine ligase